MSGTDIAMPVLTSLYATPTSHPPYAKSVTEFAHVWASHGCERVRTSGRVMAVRCAALTQRMAMRCAGLRDSTWLSCAVCGAELACGAGEFKDSRLKQKLRICYSHMYVGDEEDDRSAPAISGLFMAARVPFMEADVTFMAAKFTFVVMLLPTLVKVLPSLEAR
eukprot:3223904-Rhodomonas_salina.3